MLRAICRVALLLGALVLVVLGLVWTIEDWGQWVVVGDLVVAAAGVYGIYRIIVYRSMAD